MSITRKSFLTVITGFTATRLFSRKTIASTAKSQSASVDLLRFLECVSSVETGNDDSKVGKSGERSKYQISLIVWRQHTTQPFYLCKGTLATAIAIRHVVWLKRNLLIKTPHWLAYAWNAGLASAAAPHVNTNAYNFAQRVENLYNNK